MRWRRQCLDPSPAATSGGTTAPASESTAASATTAASTDGTTAATEPLRLPDGRSTPRHCADPARAEQPIEGTVKIGSAMPLSGGPAAAFGPVKDGFQLYLDFANAKGLAARLHPDRRHPGRPVRRHPDAGVVDGLIDGGVDMFSGIIGTPNNLAVRDTLNEECIPQLVA